MIVCIRELMLLQIEYSNNRSISDPNDDVSGLEGLFRVYKHYLHYISYFYYLE